MSYCTSCSSVSVGDSMQDITTDLSIMKHAPTTFVCEFPPQEGTHNEID